MIGVPNVIRTKWVEGDPINDQTSFYRDTELHQMC